MRGKSRQCHLWNAHEVASATAGHTNGEWFVNGISIDSRTIKSGDLFIAIKGLNQNGHNYVNDALEKGAVGAIVSTADARKVNISLDESKLLRVVDTREALEKLAAFARTRSEARIIAITGSVGKTSTKEALKLALEATAGSSREVCATKGNLNNHWGLPLSLANLSQKATYGVFEMGMSRRGEISPLSRMARPHVAVITNVTHTHSEFFESLDQIAEAKAEIFDGLTANGVAVLNIDNPMYQILSAAAKKSGVSRILSFGSLRKADCRLINMELKPTSSDIKAEVDGKKISYLLGAPGYHHVINSLAILGCLHAVGADINAGVSALTKFEGLKGRGKQHCIHIGAGTFELIDESYNASPASMAAAIQVLAQKQPIGRGRKIAVLGDMLELGDNASALHAALVDPLTHGGTELVFLVGQLMSALWDVLPNEIRGGHAKTAKNLIPMLTECVQPGDVMMIKGSFGTSMHSVVDYFLKRSGEKMSSLQCLGKGS
tara:strand:+ start:1087 stop:2562 length:1476 start_codon:yes stop_codon:yes gene_type:complete